MRRPPNRRLLAAGLITVSLALAGCSTEGTPSATEETNTESASAAANATGAKAATAKCVASQLSGSLTQGDAGAGQRSATLTVKNTGNASCTLQGYPGLGLYYMSGTALPTDAQRSLDPKPALVTLAAGASAKANLRWSVISGTGDQPGDPCQPPPQQLRIIPPDETKQVSIAWTFGSVCSKGRLQESAFYK